MKKALTYLLILVAIAMIVAGALNSIIPPILTGIGFIIIAIIFLNEEKKSE